MLKSAASVLAALALAVLLVHAYAGAVWAQDFSVASYPHNENWMKNLPDNTLITQLTIPGTHDSATDRGHCEENRWIVPIIEYVSCQTYPFISQLNMGIRFFDIRLAYENGTLRFHHGPYYLEQHFEDALDAAHRFLKDNPSEFVIFLIKQEHTSESAGTFWERVNDQISDYPSSLFYLEKKVPTVGEVRGKIIIMGRADTSHLKGYRVHWDGNTTHYEGSDKDLVYVVEDHYSLKTVSTATKYREARQNIAQAMICSAGGNPNTLFLTFLSGEGDPFHTPGHYADYVNEHINDWIRRDAESGVRGGIVVMDYAGNSDHNGFEIIDTVIKQNKFVSNN